MANVRVVLARVRSKLSSTVAGQQQQQKREYKRQTVGGACLICGRLDPLSQAVDAPAARSSIASTARPSSESWAAAAAAAVALPVRRHDNRITQPRQ